MKWIHALGAASVPRLHDIAIDGRVLLFTLAVSLLSGLLFGLAPALRLSRLDLHEQPEGRQPGLRRDRRGLGPRAATCAGCSSWPSWRSA